MEVLLDLLKADGVDVPPATDEAVALSQYAVETRYPGEWEALGNAEAQSALGLGSQVLAWVEEQMR